MTSNSARIEFRSRLSWSTLWLYPLAIIVLAVAFSSCTKDHIDPPPPTRPDPSPSPRPSNVFDENAVNVLKFGVNHPDYCSAGSYTNKPCAKVTVCDMGGANCKEINDVLIDTGSYGLRIFKQRLGNVNLGTSSTAECMEYGDGSKQWGPIVQAKVKLGREGAVTVPIQVIDANYPGMDQKCPNAERYPDQGPTDEYAGMSGILGIGVFISDCGNYCATTEDNNVYFDCTGGTCKSAKVGEANQVQNPIAHLSTDGNGVMVKLPGVDLGGAYSLPGNMKNGTAVTAGFLVFGIGTRDNNSPQNASLMQVDSNFGEATTRFQGTDYRSFIDTGSNALGIPSNTSMPDCGLTDSNFSGWLCPAGTLTNQPTTITSSTGYSRSVKFNVGNFITLFGDGNGPAVYSESAYASGGNISGFFDWGLPFYFGKEVYHGFENRASVLGNGPYWAW